MSVTNSFLQRKIEITITLGTGQFGSSGSDTVTLSGLRTIVTIQRGGGPSMDQAVVRVYGVTPTIMNAVSTLGTYPNMVRHNNFMQITAGDATNGMQIVYSGYLSFSYQDFSEAPDTAMVLQGFGAPDLAILKLQPVSFPGPVNAAYALELVAKANGLNFESNGVQATIPATYEPGTGLSQLDAICRAANVDWTIDTSTSPRTLAIWPKNGTRQNQPIPLISAKTGLIGYPSYQQYGITFKCLFNPAIRIGGQVQIESVIGSEGSNPSVSPGFSGGPNGFWQVFSPLIFDLSSELPDGPWFTEVSCIRVPR